MRAVCLLALSGCIISAPDGAPQTWPPPLGVTVQAVTAGDLDGNGSTEVVVYSSGTDAQAGMYLITGGKDFGGTTPVKSFSKFVPAKLKAPTAALQVGGAAPEVFVATGTSNVEIKAYSNILGAKASIDSSVPATGSLLWLHPVMFPGAMQHIAVSNGSVIDHAATDLSETRNIPPPSGPSWDLAQLATSYASGSDQVVVVATPTQILRSPLPSPTVMSFVWTTVRSGTGWLGQTSVDLDGDGREEIIGLDLAGKQICVVDPGVAAVPVTPVCLALASTLSTGTEVTIFIGTNLTPNASPDILVAQAGAADTQYTIVEDYTYAAGSLVATSIKPGMTAGPAHGRTVIINEGPGTPNAAITFGVDGAVSCVMGPC